MRFQPPTIQEVSTYMQEKKGWPEKFCNYYAEKFFYHYEASGWKLSNGNAMKNWQAAFNSQWQFLKFREDIDFFNSCKQTYQPKTNPDREYLNERLMEYKKNWDSISDESYVAWYDFMKGKKMLSFSKDEIETIRTHSEGDVDKGKALAVRVMFNRMITQEQRF